MKKNNVTNELKFCLPARGENEAVARAMVAAFAAQLNPTIAELADVKCIVSEAVTNAIVHAYRDRAGGGEVYITVTCFRDRRVKITVKDTGCGIEDVEQARRPLYTGHPEEERSGMGFAVMENFSDRMSVVSKPAHGTKVTLWKYLRG